MKTLDDVLSWLDDNHDDLTKMTKVRSRANRYLLSAKKKGLTPAIQSSEIVVTTDTEVIVKPKKELDSEAIELANMLYSEVKLRYAWLKTPNLEQWTKDIQLIHTADGYDYGTIRVVMFWSQRDPFWQLNIRSGSKLREKFEELSIRAKRQVFDNQIEEI